MHFEITNIFGATKLKDVRVPVRDFDDYFDLGYCMNVHRVQGSTINEPISIYEWNSNNMNRNAKYTAITRATKYEFVNIMPSTAPSFPYHKQFLCRKIKGYTAQDEVKSRDTDLTVDNVKKLITDNSNTCFNFHECNNDLHEENFTLDRLDNAHGHLIKNVRLSCLHCNVRKLM